jgi:MFS family permease
MAFLGLSKRDFSIVIGNAVDHFDSALYGFLAPIMGPIFFPNHDPAISIILAYSIFATSIITRPLGSLIFGYIANRYGALNSLYYSLIGVAVTTMMIGLLPSHAAIGVFAPISLTLIRGVREIFSSGEMSIAKLYILENKEGGEALKASYIYQTSSMAGIVCASFLSVIVVVLDSPFGWRLCFLAGGVTAIAGVFIRLYDRGQDNLQNITSSYSKDIITILWRHKREVLQVASVVGLSYLTYSVPFIVMNSIIPLIANVSFEEMMALNTALLVFDMLILPLIGMKLTEFDARKIILIASIILLISVPPCWYFLQDSGVLYITLVRIWIIILGCIIACPLNVWCNSLLRSNSKYLVVGIGNSLGVAVIGKMTPAICLGIYYYSGSHMLIIAYISLVIIAAIWGLKGK